MTIKRTAAAAADTDTFVSFRIGLNLICSAERGITGLSSDQYNARIS